MVNSARGRVGHACNKLHRWVICTEGLEHVVAGSINIVGYRSGRSPS
jgi:hypothetical protein